MKKRILISSYSLGLGGIEQALINLLNFMDKTKYDITLVLEKKEGIFLDQLPKEIEVIEYKISESKNVVIRKISNRLKLLKWKITHKNKYDFAISFTTYSRPGAHIALNASKNNALWIHNNYFEVYDGNIEAIKEFFKTVQASKFNNMVFVSNDNKEIICKYFPEYSSKSIVFNNVIDYDKIYSKSLEKNKIKKDKITFVNVGRHEEHQKRLSRIIEASKKLKQEGYSFNIWFIGDGIDHEKYVSMVKDNNLEDVILFLGKQSNPFPYYKKADAVLLSSKYEGYPVVFIEAMVMNKPLITTKVSDYQEVEGKYGIVVENTDDGVYEGMKEFLERGYTIQSKFDPKMFNDQIGVELNNLIERNEVND